MVIVVAAAKLLLLLLSLPLLPQLLLQLVHPLTLLPQLLLLLPLLPLMLLLLQMLPLLLLLLLAATAAAAAAATADATTAATAYDDTLVAPWASGGSGGGPNKIVQTWPSVDSGWTSGDLNRPAIPLSPRPQHPLPLAWLPLASPCVHGFRLL